MLEGPHILSWLSKNERDFTLLPSLLQDWKFHALAAVFTARICIVTRQPGTFLCLLFLN